MELAACLLMMFSHVSSLSKVRNINNKCAYEQNINKIFNILNRINSNKVDDLKRERSLAQHSSSYFSFQDVLCRIHFIINFMDIISL